MLRLSQAVLVLFFALNHVNGDVSKKLSITVYYESKCPDSRDFIVQQLYPTINLLHQYIVLKFVPFGKAHSKNKGRNGFQCQHGPTECHGNMVQSCALDLLQRRNNVEKVSYVVCEMQTQAGTVGNLECVMRAGLKPQDVEHCIESGKGTALQRHDEYMTKLVKPKFVPTITIDGVFNQQVQDSAMENLTETICSIFTDIPPCAQHYNTQAMSYILY